MFLEGLIGQRVVIDEMQCSFISNRGTPDSIFIVRQLQEKHSGDYMSLYITTFR